MPHCVDHSPHSPGTWQSHERHLTLLRGKCSGLPSVPWSLPRCHPKISTAGSFCQLLHFWLTRCCCTRCFPFHQAWIGDSSGTGLRRPQLSQCAKIGTLICSPHFDQWNNTGICSLSFAAKQPQGFRRQHLVMTLVRMLNTHPAGICTLTNHSSVGNSNTASHVLSVLHLMSYSREHWWLKPAHSTSEQFASKVL